MELKSKRDRLQVGLLLLPGLLVFALFTIYPIGKLLYMSFLQWDLGSMQHQKFIGLQNYIDVLSDKTFRVAFANTLIYTLVTVPGQMILGLLAAVLINAIPRFRVTFRVIYYIPVITSWVIVSLIFRYIFNTEGMLNYVLTNALHLTASNPLARRPLGRTDGCDDARHLEGRRVESGRVPGRAAKRSPGVV